jgi:hypothetical protein
MTGFMVCISGVQETIVHYVCKVIFIDAVLWLVFLCLCVFTKHGKG